MNTHYYKTKAAVVMRRLEELAAITDEPGRVTRWFFSPAMKRANAKVGEWMAASGMKVREDGWGNLLGRWESSGADKVFLMGSHLDTVRNAGKYDGTLGVVLALGVVEVLKERGVKLPFHLEVAGFSDEEGLRFQATYLGSRALLGKIEKEDLERLDAEGVRLGTLVVPPDVVPEPFYRPGELLGYVEAHIEQGPVLESRGEAVGMVTAIAGQSRVRVFWEGQADHAGTCPMGLRRDALAGAADFVLAVEQCGLETQGLVATVGQLEVEPGASNVIPGKAVLTVDVRHADDGARRKAVEALKAEAEAIASARGLEFLWEAVQEHPAVACDPGLVGRCVEAVRTASSQVPLMISGAGHDAAVFAGEVPAAMLLVRSPGGVSHHPDEKVLEEDVAVAMEVLVRLFEQLGEPA